MFIRLLGPIPPPSERYNLVVIGAGTAGLVTAAGAAGLGAEVALIERALMGDCSPYQFTHAADFMARIVIQNALFIGRKKASSLVIPWSTYTSPEIAHVGLYQHQAKEKNIEIDTYVQKFHEVDDQWKRALASNISNRSTQRSNRSVCSGLQCSGTHLLRSRLFKHCLNYQPYPSSRFRSCQLSCPTHLSCPTQGQETERLGIMVSTHALDGCMSGRLSPNKQYTSERKLAESSP